MARKNKIDPIPPDLDILSWLNISAKELTDLVRANPSLRGMIVGYASEHHLHKIFKSDQRVDEVGKDDDHDRSGKGDMKFLYKNRIFRIESKSIQTNSIKKTGEDPVSYKCSYQCDASDSRLVTFSDGSSVVTTSLMVGEFDIVAIPLFPLTGKWEYAYALNKDLPRASSKKKYTALQRVELLSTSMPLVYPLQGIYKSNIYELMDEILK